MSVAPLFFFFSLDLKLCACAMMYFAFVYHRLLLLFVLINCFFVVITEGRLC
jgi:hypothetical protein